MRTQLYGSEYDEVTHTANLVIAKYVKSYPLDIYELMASIQTIKFRAYSDGDETFKAHCLKMSDTGFSYVCGKRMEVIYNDLVPRKCMSFSVLHELGHLGEEHAVKRELFFDELCAEYGIECDDSDLLWGEAKLKYNAFCDRQERAANYFADVVIAPNWLIDRIKPDEPRDLCEALGIGFTCADMRLKSYRRWVRLGRPKVSPWETVNAHTIVINLNKEVDM